ncbi:MAG: TIGR02281 family clan AA aspartic protease [Alphaproteobacteria bacterium]|nr:TIGR02281 family clan AA aspartic protease [Alphaproteobacteria bacterium]
MDRSTVRTAHWAALAIVLAWLILGGLIYLGWLWYESIERASLQPYAGQGGELVLPRHADGHFYVSGEVNHASVVFMIDTGATAVSISEEQARQARLPAGREIQIRTANGETRGELVHGVPVRAGHLVWNDTTVVRGLVGLPSQQALLGQSFLRQFDIELREREMVLRPRP